jgi:hypothetical protein
MNARQWARLFRNMWRQSPRMAVRVLVRHVVIRLRGDGLVKVPTPLQEMVRTAPNGDTLLVEQSYRSGSADGPLIVKYRRVYRTLN